MIQYMEIYDHWMAGPHSAKFLVDETMFAFLLTWARDKDDELDNEVYDLLEQELKAPLQFDEALWNYKTNGRRAALIQAKLASVGYWAGEGEEGSFGFCVAGKEKQLKSAIARIEARVAMKGIGW